MIHRICDKYLRTLDFALERIIINLQAGIVRFGNLLLYLLYCHPHSGSEYQRKENNDAEYRKQNLVFQ